MSSSSSSSSRYATRRGVYGVPTRCWCGHNLKTFVSKTNENPYRRFYRCVVASQRESENHLFKWEDEALLDETKLVDAKRLDLLHDVQTISKGVMDQLAGQERRLAELKQELEFKLLNISRELDAKLDAYTIMNTELLDKQATPHVRDPLNNIAVAVAVIGALGWLYFKLA